jgi:hypothetical protein
MTSSATSRASRSTARTWEVDSQRSISSQITSSRGREDPAPQGLAVVRLVDRQEAHLGIPGRERLGDPDGAVGGAVLRQDHLV